ncbi:MAG: type IV pilus assembly protein PilM [Deltaproteobacteria bacterium]
MLGGLRGAWSRMTSGGAGSYVVVDIGSSAIKLLEVRGAPEGLEILRAGIAPVPAGALRNNTIEDTVAVSDVVRRLVDELGVQAIHAVTAVPGPSVIIKKALLQLRADEDLESLLMIEAQSFIPESIENVSLDYQVLRHEDAEAEILLVAVRRDILDRYTSAISQAGLEPIIVDVDYFALENMFELNYGRNEDATIAIVNVGARYSSINIIKGGISTTTGDVQAGGGEITDALVSSLGVSYDDAERLQAGEDLGAAVAERARPILERGAAGLAEALVQALRFLSRTASDEPLQTIYLSGGGARTPGLLEGLASRLTIEVEIVNPFARLQISRNLDSEALQEMAPALAVAVGLGTRRPGDE